MIKKTLKKIPPYKRVVAYQNSLLLEMDELRKAVVQYQKNEKSHQQIFGNPRELLSKRYLGGKGIEIGAAHQPLKVTPTTHVKYVDIASTPDLRILWPEIAKLDIVDVDIVDNGEMLKTFKKSSLDFIIANHFIEHCLDPIGTILNFYRVLKPHGVIYLAVPDKRRTFDKDRPLTTYNHLLEEHKGSKSFQEEHTLEYVKLAEKVKGKVKAQNRANVLIKSDYRIHFHVWTQAEFIELIQSMAKDFSVLIEIEAMVQSNNEFILIIRKSQKAK